MTERSKRFRLKTLVLACVLVGFAAGQAPAQSITEKLSQCLVLKTSGADRVDLVRWMTFAFTAHPSIQGDITISPAALEDANKKLAALFTELMTVRCKAESKAAIESDASGRGFESAFEALGSISAQEIFNDSQVKIRLGDFAKFIDENRIKEALK